ncbi:MAG: TetR/AcrR family transcriptional regulator [Lachnospiraceae bacterium]|nr:TetR/AcrR family transcriptional regulator [Lachnospiraceae bacterium]
MKHTSNDLRVRRTLKLIRDAFYEMVLENNYNEISITDLAEKATINRKTFYLHYSSLDDLIQEIEQEIADEILDIISEDIENLDIKGCIGAFYRYLDNSNRVQKKLFCDTSYHIFDEGVMDLILDSDKISSLFDKTAHPEIVRTYSLSITYIYRDWVTGESNTSLDELIDYASQLVTYGYSGIIPQK